MNGWSAASWDTTTEVSAELPSPQALPASTPAAARRSKAGKRFKWSNEMVTELPRLRFANGDVKNRLGAA
ncbi:hypothetical protein PC114_g21312 [Phytophthora cactorum]|uniref:Uncharacterized protein n=1 Tax=Phytophthora cactorum TaxID=29920 RepID=A0A8T1AG04_9STRA|nr:hypothetical protein PC112_g9641 [Phytophthora cactorum]KAG2881588.1 hypothetical protein PC117_g26367 [Phytophthora cactorum]KAG2881916.1 hypothetical protein PC114_g21312 [Phytophthora cactorum]KAG2974900.1 hypothetical protein PC120_g25930 [Phytophthora cactorum]KAG3135757.1 hypothetical protein C6341_g21661 [Phytophthora cactorum]